MSEKFYLAFVETNDLLMHPSAQKQVPPSLSPDGFDNRFGSLFG
jgi:hypothetical protein